MEENEIIYSIRIIIVGDEKVGKTNIINTASRNEFNENYLSSIGMDVSKLYIKINEKTFKLQLWDSSGKEKYHSITQEYYRNSACAIVVYDITDKKSFESLKRWIDECKYYNKKNIILILVGNKKDLEQSRKITEKEGREFAEKNLINYFFESSAKTGENINEIFRQICEIVNKKIDGKNVDFSDDSNGIKMLKNYNDNHNDYHYGIWDDHSSSSCYIE